MNSVVGVGDWKVSKNIDDTIITYALGSCLGVVIYDPIERVAGLLHVMLPLSKTDPAKAKIKPARYVDTGFATLLADFYDHGGQKKNMKLYVAGGATMRKNSQDDYFKIGSRNFTTLRKLLWKNGLMIDFQDVGGNISRTVAVRIKDGLVTINKQPVSAHNFRDSNEITTKKSR